MDLRQLTVEYSVSPQISVDELATLKDLGFKSIVCNRPDNEDPGQPSFAEIAQKAKDLGFETAHIPVVGQPSPDAIKDMVDALDELPKPILAYCRSGNRSGVIYQMTQHLR